MQYAEHNPGQTHITSQFHAEATNVPMARGQTLLSFFFRWGLCRTRLIVLACLIPSAKRGYSIFAIRFGRVADCPNCRSLDRTPACGAEPFRSSWR
jgi:hypothetical protein